MITEIAFPNYIKRYTLLSESIKIETFSDGSWHFFNHIFFDTKKELYEYWDSIC